MWLLHGCDKSEADEIEDGCQADRQGRSQASQSGYGHDEVTSAQSQFAIQEPACLLVGTPKVRNFLSLYSSEDITQGNQWDPYECPHGFVVMQSGREAIR